MAPGPRTRSTAALAAALLGLSAGPLACGYSLALGGKLRGGAETVEVRLIENDSVDPGVGAAVTAALREALARRAVPGGSGARAVISGTAHTESAPPSAAAGALLRVVLEVRARLTVDGAVVAERTVRREADHLGGADALEGETRRAQALQRLAAEVARELVVALEE
jgi:Lipopolysaccharide-assembly